MAEIILVMLVSAVIAAGIVAFLFLWALAQGYKH